MVDLSGELPGASEAADRIALRALVDSYAHVLDNRLRTRFATLFCEDGRLVLPHPAGRDRPQFVFDGRDGWARAFAVLAPFDTTVHFVGNHLVSIEEDAATGETYCLAHELYDRGGTRRMTVRSVRYLDSYRRIAGRWFFRVRELVVDWVDDRALTAPPTPRSA
jgi:hypothetical protein